MAERTAENEMPGGDRIWVVSELYAPEDTSTGHFLTGIAEGLARRLEVGVLCGQPSYAARGRPAPRRERLNGVDVHRCWATTLDKDVLATRLVNLLSVSVSIFWQATRRFRRGDRVLVVTNPPLLPFVVRAACRLRGARCVLLVHDVYPDVLVVTGMSRPDGLLPRLVGRLHRGLYRRVERIVVLGRDMAALVGGRTGDGGRRLRIVPNFADVEEIVPLPRASNPMLGELGIRDRFVVQWSGNIGRTHGIEDLLAAARQLRGEADVLFMFVGGGAKRSLLEKASAEPHGDNLLLLTRRPRAELGVSLNACDLAILALLPRMTGVSVPSRMYDVMAAGRPLLAVVEETSEVARVIREEGIGWVVPPGAPERIAEAVLEARASPDELRAMGERARRAAERRYSLAAVLRAYEALFAELPADGSS